MKVNFFFAGRSVNLNFKQIEVARLNDMAAANGLAEESLPGLVRQFVLDRPGLAEAIDPEDLLAVQTFLSPPLH